MAESVKDLDRRLRMLSQEWRIRELSGRKGEAHETWSKIEELLDERYRLQTQQSVSA